MNGSDVGGCLASIGLLVMVLALRRIERRDNNECWRERCRKAKVFVAGLLFGGVVLFVLVIPNAISGVRFGCDGIVNLWTGGRPAREELMELHSQLHIGQTKEEVRNVVRDGQWRLLTVREGVGKRNEPDLWLVSTPGELWAQNWILLLQFDGNCLSWVRTGTMDSAVSRPDGAPEDKKARK